MGRPSNAEIAARQQRVEEKLPQVGSLRTLQNEPISGQKWKVVIYADQNDKGDVDIQVNGYNVRIKRGQEVILDDAYVEVLRNARIDTFEYDPQTNARTPSTRMAYPFQATPIPQAA